MKLSEWNERLFHTLVVARGSFGDPLYLYIDAEILADIADSGSPEQALNDFQQAFSATTFEREYCKSVRWESGGYEGIPPFVTALVITVLGVTLEPLGVRANNVSARSRQLLGEPIERQGNPKGYNDYVPMLWKAWNRWLQAEGQQFGVPTAKNDPTYKIQGWARSQSFIRHEDKQDIYEFFKSNSQKFEGREFDLAKLQLLEEWLSRRGKNRRLISVVSDRNAHEEILGMLQALLKYWDGDIEARAKPKSFNASLMWKRTDGLALIVDFRREKISTNQDLADLRQEKISRVDNIFYLTPIDMQPHEWFHQPFLKHELSPDWRVAWNPEYQDFFILEKTYQGLWLQEISGKFVNTSYRVLGREDSPLPKGFSFGDSPVSGMRWVLSSGKSEITKEEVLYYFIKEKTLQKTSPRLASLTGGLPLSRGNKYLSGGEPTLIVKYQEGLIPEVSLDGNQVEVSVVDSEGNWYYRLFKEYPSPGLHKVLVTQGSASQRINFEVVEPRYKFFEERREKPQVQNLDLKLVEARSSPQLLLLSSSGQIHEIEVDTSPKSWLRQLPIKTNHRVIDFIHIEQERIDSTQTLIAYKESVNRPWTIVALDCDESQLADARIYPQHEIADSSFVFDLIFSDKEIDFFDELSEKHFQKFRAKVDLLSSPETFNAVKSHTHRKALSFTDAADENFIFGSIPKNPLDELLFWLTEVGDEGVSIPVFEDSLFWVFEKNKWPEPKFQSVFSRLMNLGHIDYRAGTSRITISSPQLTMLPDSEGFAFLSGKRSEDLISNLENDPDSRLSKIQVSAHGKISTEIFTQIHPDKGGVPLAPSMVLIPPSPKDIQFLTDNLELEFAATESYDRLNQLPYILDSVTPRDSSYSLPPGTVTMDIFVPSGYAPLGRWVNKRRAEVFEQELAFLRLTTGRQRTYLWWDWERNSLAECDFYTGLWAYHSQISREKLVFYGDPTNRFSVRSEVPLPAQFERAIVLRSGILPLEVTREDQKYLVYENCSRFFAKKISEKLGQSI